jgi:DNA (cytosine-5)-methyltransferase 1
MKRLTAVSLFSGAGGMDVGMESAGFQSLWANEIDPKACETFRLNHPKTKLVEGDLRQHLDELKKLNGVDLLHGGPPCQGFSVAGKMDPKDPRSELIWVYLEALRILQPRAFVCENVAALGLLTRWRAVRQGLLQQFHSMGYESSFVVLNSSDYGVPQNRERVFFIGLKDGSLPADLKIFSQKFRRKSPVVRSILLALGKPGSEKNQGICKAKITIAQSPVLRKSPYAGMLFNGLGRPLRLDGYSSTMHASMGGNKTPFVDEEALYNGKKPWVEDYHSKLWAGGKPIAIDEAPPFLRRITVSEAKAIQSFPSDYVFHGSQSSQFCQIGNAVPCGLAEAVGRLVFELLEPSELEGSASADEERSFCLVA